MTQKTQIPDFITIEKNPFFEIDKNELFLGILDLIEELDDGSWQRAFTMLIVFEQLKKSFCEELAKRMASDGLDPETMDYLRRNHTH